jgi:two-component system response regulator CpxR
MSTRLVLVDDDLHLVEMMREYLEPEGFAIDHVGDGRLVHGASPNTADMVLLDVMLPGSSGFAILKDLRRNSDVPVIMLTARDDDVDRIVGLELGADDYVAKPFNPRELVARIRAILRRVPRGGMAIDGDGTRLNASGTLRVGDVTLDPRSRTATKAGEELDLTSAEFNLLARLLERPGEVLGREELSVAAFGRGAGSNFDRNVDTLVCKLRRKLDPTDDTEHRIKTIRNAGYLYAVRPAGHH